MSPSVASINLADLLTTREAALLLRVKPNTLETQRSEGKGPPYIRLGGRGSAVRYYRPDLEDWLREQSTAQVPSAAEDLMAGSVAQKLGYSPDEAATLAGMCRSNIFKAMKSGNLPARKLGRRTIILHDDLQNFLESLPVRGAA